MEFPYSNKPSVNESAGQRSNSKPKASEGFMRGAGVLRDYSGVNLGGNSDVRRAVDPVSAGPSRASAAVNYGHPNPAGTAAGVDSDVMLSLDDILNDLHKKVVSVDVNAFEVKGQPGNPLGFRSEKPGEAYGGIEGNRVGEYKVEGAGSRGGNEGYGGEPKRKDVYNVEANASRRREEQFNADFAGSLGRNEQLKGQVSGLREEFQVVGVMQRKEPKYGVAGSLNKSGQQLGEVTSSLERNQQSKGGVAELAERSETGEVAAPHVMGDQYKGEVAGSQYVSEARNPHMEGELYEIAVAGPEIVGVQYKGEAAGPQGTGEQQKVAGLDGTSEQHKGESAVVNGTIEPYKGEAASTVQIHDQNQEKGKFLVPAQGDNALGQAIEPAFLTPDGRGGKSRRHTEIIQSPDWLPKGWFTELKTRGGGSSAGTKDKYYYDPVTQRRFRSKIEVLSYLETGVIGRYRPKGKSEGQVGQVGRKRKASAAFYQYAATFDNSFRPTKVRWVLNDTDGSWIPFVNEENSVDFNRKEGERLFDLNRNGADACDHGQGEATGLKDTNPLTSLKSDIIEVVIDPSTQKKVSEDILPFVDSWSDPCLEFAVKTLTGAFPNLEENLALKHAVEKLWVGSSDSNPLGSEAFPDVSGCGQCSECPSLAKEQLRFKRKLHESNTSQNILSVGSLSEKALNRYKHGYREKQQQVKVLLEPLGRKLCNRALDFLKGHKHSSLHLGKQAKNISMSFHVIDYGHQNQNILNSPSALCD